MTGNWLRTARRGEGAERNVLFQLSRDYDLIGHVGVRGGHVMGLGQDLRFLEPLDLAKLLPDLADAGEFARRAARMHSSPQPEPISRTREPGPTPASSRCGVLSRRTAACRR